MGHMSELHADAARVERLTASPIVISPRGTNDVKLAVAEIQRAVWRIERHSDPYAMLRELTKVRDACIQAALTIKAVADEARDEAIRKVS